MKKNLMSLMLVLAMVTGVTLAFATHKSGATENKRFGKLIDAMNNVTWVDVTGKVQGVDYECLSSQEICTTQFVGDNPANAEITSSRIAGRFQQ